LAFGQKCPSFRTLVIGLRSDINGGACAISASKRTFQTVESDDRVYRDRAENVVRPV